MYGSLRQRHARHLHSVTTKKLDPSHSSPFDPPHLPPHAAIVAPAAVRSAALLIQAHFKHLSPVDGAAHPIASGLKHLASGGTPGSHRAAAAVIAVAAAAWHQRAMSQGAKELPDAL